MTVLFLGLLIALSSFKFVPELKREIIRTSNTDWIILNVRSKTGLGHIKKIEGLTDKVEDHLLEAFGEKIQKPAHDEKYVPCLLNKPALTQNPLFSGGSTSGPIKTLTIA